MTQFESELELEAADVTALALSAEKEGVIRHARMWDHFRELIRTSWIFRIGLTLVAIALVLTAVGPYLATHDLTAATGDIAQAPNGTHWFGTDPSGFDVFSRVLASPRVDVTIGIAATAISLFVGCLLGLLTSFFGGWVGETVTRASDTVQAFPIFVMAIAIVVMAGRSVTNIILVIAILNVPIFLRLTRSQVLSIREYAFIEAARANGDSELSIAIRHVLPNAMTPAFAQASITLGGAILITAGLSFIGAGVQPPTPEWGAMINAGSNGIIIGEWWTSIFPGIAMSLTVFGFAAVGQGLQNVLLRRV